MKLKLIVMAIASSMLFGCASHKTDSMHTKFSNDHNVFNEHHSQMNTANQGRLQLEFIENTKVTK